MTQLFGTICATAWFWTFSIGFLASIFTSIALLFCSTLWWVIPIYALWIFYDRKTCEKGGRPSQCVRQWLWWRQMRYYFNHKLIKDDNAEFDAKKNYLMACFPHGMLPIGPFASFVDGFQTVFTNHTPYLTALNIQFLLPFIRELFLWVGAVSVSGPSLKYLLGDKKGGNMVSILIGGADEAKYSQPGKYKIILNKRKGFVKLALQTGSPIVPVISFGETDAFDQLDFPGLACIREIVKKTVQIGLVIPKGKWFICPRSVPVTTVVGVPIEVQQVESPTNEQIEALHQQFVEGIRQLFEKFKHSYVQNPEDTFLEIV